MSTMTIAAVAGALGAAAIAAVAATALTKRALARRRERKAQALRERLEEARTVHARIGRHLKTRGEGAARHGAPGQETLEKAHQAVGKDFDALEERIGTGVVLTTAGLAWSDAWLSDIESALGPARYSDTPLASYDALEKIRIAQGEGETLSEMEKAAQALEREWEPGAEAAGTHAGQAPEPESAGETRESTQSALGQHGEAERASADYESPAGGDSGGFDSGASSFDSGSGGFDSGGSSFD